MRIYVGFIVVLTNPSACRIIDAQMSAKGTQMSTQRRVVHLVFGLGVDFGTLSARALLVNLETGDEVATAEAPYRNGVIDSQLPASGEQLPPEWAIQDADDYLEALTESVREVVAQGSVDSEQIVSIGIDTTACTMIPSTAELVPLSRIPAFRNCKYAYAKLWKDHSSQYCADDLNSQLRNIPGYLECYGGNLSPEWMLPKTLLIYRECREVFDSSDLFMEQEDWIVSNLVGKVVQGAHVAGYKGGYRVEGDGYPNSLLLEKVEKGYSIVLQKLGHDFKKPGELAGKLIDSWAEKLGLCAGVPVAVGNMDAHVAMLGAGVIESGTMVAVMGTSVCNLIVDNSFAPVKGIQGVVYEGIIPKKWAYEAGQAGVGDSYGWFVNHIVRNKEAANTKSVSEVFKALEEEASCIKPGGSGLIAMDWMNGNRSVLIDSRLSGLFVGLTVSSTIADMYRALLESTAMGQRIILETFANQGIEINRIVACGGLPRKSPLLMQILADVTGQEIEVTLSSNTPALGAALHGAIAAGVCTSWEQAASLVRKDTNRYIPNAENTGTYEKLYQIYRSIHDFFGVNNPSIMHNLRKIRSHC